MPMTGHLGQYEGQSTVGEGDIYRIKKTQLGRNNHVRGKNWNVKEGVTHSSRGEVMGLRRRLHDGHDIVMLGPEA